METNNKTVVLPEAKNPLTAAEADRMAALIKLDIAHYRRERARFMAQVADIDFMIAESETALADLDRRVANVDYPPQPEPKAEPTPADGADGGLQIGEPVGPGDGTSEQAPEGDGK